jgi:hypothetical protein
VVDDLTGLAEGGARRNGAGAVRHNENSP